MNGIQNFSLDAEQIENISEDDLDELETLVDLFVELCEEHEREINAVVSQINESEVYEEMDVGVNVNIEHSIEYSERDEN